jgi:polygalacturonase
MNPTTPIPEACGASVRPDMLQKTTYYNILDFGASTGADAQSNTKAINAAITAAAHNNGGTVIIPAGTYNTYTIRLKSNVNLFLTENAVIAAAMPNVLSSNDSPEMPLSTRSPRVLHNTENPNVLHDTDSPVSGGNYDEPEVNPWVGLQDHGHSYCANSLVYGADLENVMIFGKGLFTGGRYDDATGILDYVLSGADPAEPSDRTLPGHNGNWFGNKAIALVRCKNVVLTDFSITIGGHFALIAEGCQNLYVEHILIDTTRDAFDIDSCQDVTVLHSVCNSLTDDALCLKASLGAGILQPLYNVLIEDCVVSGYDAGSVYAGTFTRDKLIAEDRCGPTGRVKFGTESTGGGHRITIRRIKFQRSRGFALEAVDGSSLSDIIFTDCTMEQVSSSPVFIRAGERGRFPVTGCQKSDSFPSDVPDVRLDNSGWILPNTKDYPCYPAKRYAPHYNRTRKVTVDGHSFFSVVDEDAPAAVNPVNLTFAPSDAQQDAQAATYLKANATKFAPSDAQQDAQAAAYLKVWNGQTHRYETDFSRQIPSADLPLYANAIGHEKMACVENVYIGNIRITDADPRYPILLMGLTDSHLRNITLENIDVEYRGGLSMEHAIEQRQLNTEWKYSQFHAKERVQTLPWLVNTFFLKHEGLLPRTDWDAVNSCWRADSYNVPELPEVYPEPSNWGILPAYGIFAKHVDELTLRNIRISCKVPDGRHMCVLDDASNIRMQNVCEAADMNCTGMQHYGNTATQDCMTSDTSSISMQHCGRTSAQDTFTSEHIAPVAVITDYFRRHTNAEYVPEQPYFTTTVTNLQIEPSMEIMPVEINAPAPGTPADSLYRYPTVPCRKTGYHYAVDTEDYPLPLTVHRPFIQAPRSIAAKAGEPIAFSLEVKNPATDISDIADNGMIYNEQNETLFCVSGAKVALQVYAGNLPDGADFDAQKKLFQWTPGHSQQGIYTISFIVDDGVIPESTDVVITVK